MDFPSDVLAYEAGEMNEQEVIKFFQYLIDSKLLDHFGATYQKTADELVEQGFCTQ